MKTFIISGESDFFPAAINVSARDDGDILIGINEGLTQVFDCRAQILPPPSRALRFPMDAIVITEDGKYTVSIDKIQIINPIDWNEVRKALPVLDDILETLDPDHPGDKIHEQQIGVIYEAIKKMAS